MSVRVLSLFLGALVLGGGGVSADQNSGREVGNGGDVVYCPNAVAPRKKVELLDIYEARTRGIIFNLGAPTLNYWQKFALALERLAKVSPLRAEEYRLSAQDFTIDPATGEHRNARFLSGVELVDIPDSKHIAVPSGCAIKQIAIQKEPEVAEDRRYTVSKDLWDLMDDESKAGLILHEVIYREALVDGAENSKMVRYLNSYLAADKFAAMTQEAFFNFLAKAGLRSTDVGGMWLKLVSPFAGDPGFPMKFYPGGALRSALWESRSESSARIASWKTTDGIEIKVYIDSYGTPVEFLENGRVFRFSGHGRGDAQYELYFGGQELRSDWVLLNESGGFEFAEGQSEYNGTYWVTTQVYDRSGKLVPVSPRFGKAGEYLNSVDNFRLVDGSYRDFRPGTWLEFDAEGNVSRWY